MARQTKKAAAKLCFAAAFLLYFAIFDCIAKQEIDQLVPGAIGLLRHLVELCNRFILQPHGKNFVSVVTPECFLVDNQLVFSILLPPLSTSIFRFRVFLTKSDKLVFIITLPNGKIYVKGML